MSTATATIGASFVEHTIEAAGFTVRYLEAGTGTPLVCLPGAGGPNLTPALDLLAAQYRVILIELPGWGSQPNPVANFDDFAHQVATIIEAIGLDTYHLMGTSLGGACALHLLTLYPQRVISLTLEAPARFRENSVNPATLTEEQFLKAFRTHPEKLPVTLPIPPHAMPTVGALMGPPSDDSAFLERMQSITTRTLILFGRDDGIINPCNGPTYRSNLPGAVLIYVYDAAHDIQSDRPEAFADVVSDFIRRGLNFMVNEQDNLINP
jgi:pimeloyl-ACP methyl ester carboxylesterase